MTEKTEFQRRDNQKFDDSEIVIGLVGAIGTNFRHVTEILTTRFRNLGYEVQVLKISTDVIESLLGDETDAQTDEHSFDRIKRLMDAGNDARKNHPDMLALGAISKIHQQRGGTIPLEPRKVVIIDSLKHPAEVARFRDVYHNGFYLLGVHSEKARRLEVLTDDLNMAEKQAETLIERDKAESLKNGQQVTKTFHLADFFVRIDGNDDQLKNSLVRIVNILFGHPYETPTFDEYAMFMSFAASLRSSDLSRQVGAVITKSKVIVATGANDCPAFGGGLYWPQIDPTTGKISNEPHGRDCASERGFDSNKTEQEKIINSILKDASSSIEQSIKEDTTLSNDARSKLLEIVNQNISSALESSRVRDLTEFGRVVHAEMEALLSCARLSIDTQDATLYCTTFPCHNCAKHIVAAGLSRVVYIEPYQKSKAEEFHPDSICLGFEESDDKVDFQPFVGVGPRRFFDLFSMKLGSGYELVRQKDGKVVDWPTGKPMLRLQMLPASYLDLELMAVEAFNAIRESA